MIDYSQLSLWNFCPHAWIERYVYQRSPRYEGQRSDALCLGSLVHAGLENFTRTGRPDIPPAVVDEVTPTPGTMMLALQMVGGYVQKYPAEPWPVERVEEAIRFPLGGGLEGVAKLDGYFYVPEDTTIETGLPGERITLTRGWWSKEYKTKGQAVHRATWMQEWTTKLQADFQMLALRHLIEQQPRHRGDDITVQGVLVCVLEKPREYTPRRKCKGCGETWELASFLPTGAGYACPMCGHQQALKPYEPQTPRVPEFWRLTATRSEEQLTRSYEVITDIASLMEIARDQAENNFGLRGMDVNPNLDNCVNNKWHRVCEYYQPHLALRDSRTEAGFVTIDATKYLGLEVTT